jgi:hypothetical protein
MDTRERDEDHKESPIFVVGFPRSGTTLVSALLTAHSAIAIAPETHFINKFVNSFGKKRSDPNVMGELWYNFADSLRFKSLGVDVGEVTRIITQTNDYSESNIFRTVLKLYAATRGKVRWGEKTPNHYAHLEELLAWYPHCRIIYAIRDPRAVCNSLMSVYWRKWNRVGLRFIEPLRLTRLRRVYHDARAWQRQVDVFQTQWLNEERVMLVKYEDLVSDVSSVLRRMFLFLNEPFERNVLTARRLEDLSPMESVDARQAKWRRAHFEKAAGPISTKSVGDWRNGLYPIEIDTIENICRSGLLTMGYGVKERSSLRAIDAMRLRIVHSMGRIYCQITEVRKV